MADTYTVAQASQILGISERRVRQLVSDGKLPAERNSSGALLLPQAAVNAERKSRRGNGAGSTSGRKAAETRKASGRASVPAVDVDQLASAVASAVGSRLEGQLEITRKAESLVRQELDEERARRTAAEARLAAAETRLAAAEDEVTRLRVELAGAAQRKRRGLFRKGE